jgi:DNA-binding LacI/PurR family transcriptional regulator
LGKVSIKDIAKVAGVSHSTVSRALSGSPLVREETRSRIKQLAQEMGYYPSAVARSLVTRRTLTIGLVVTSVTDPFWAEVVGGIEGIALERGYSVLLANSNRERQRELAVVQMLGEKRVDGIIVAASRVGALYRPVLGELGVPIVLINRHSEEKEPTMHSVATDNVQGGYLATRHLLDLGHRRIGYIADPEDLSSNSDRLRGYRQALLEWDLAFNLPPDAGGSTLVVDGNGQLEGGWHAMRLLLAASAPVTGVFCYNDLTAIGALRAIREAGKKVPEDVSVIGYDDLAMAAYTDPPLTTVAQAKREMGRQAMEMILQLIADTAPVEDIVLPGQLVIRESTGPPPEYQII